MRITVLSLTLVAMTALAPLTAIAGDREIAQQVAQHIYASGQLQDYKVMVKYQDGTAYLKGEVSDSEQRDAAVRLASSSPHVNNVVNMITVAGKAASSPAPTMRPGAPPAGLANTPQFRRPQPPVQQAKPAIQRSQPPIRPVVHNSPQSRANVPTNPNHHLSTPRPPMPAAAGIPPRQYPVSQVAANVPTNSVLRRVTPAPAPQALPQRVAQPMPHGRPIANAVPLGIGGQPGAFGAPVPAYMPQAGGPVSPVRYDQPHLPSYAWPTYAAYPNYAAVTYPKQYSATAWPYIGPFYPYPQVPLGWRKVSLEWDDGWWFLDFKQRR